MAKTIRKKTRQKTRRSKKGRKTKKQKGGKTIMMFFKGITTPQALDTEKDTLSTIFEKYKAASKLNSNTDQEAYKFTVNVKTGSSTRPFIIIPTTEYSWKTKAIEILERFNLQEPISVGFELKQVSESVKKFLEDLHLVKKVLDHYAKRGGKIIVGSSAVTNTIPKNVRQQFKFYKSPVSPIILIDPGFFKNKYEFYDYLEFGEPEHIQSIGAEKVQIFRKKANTPLTINTLANHLTKEEKHLYLQEVKQQAETNGIDIEKTELEICCVSASADPENFMLKTSKTSMKPFFDLVESYKKANGTQAFAVYNWDDYFYENTVSSMENVD
jgi:hypothetical protein